MTPLRLIRKPFRYTYSFATLYLVAINIAVYILTSLYPSWNAVLGLYPPAFFGLKMYWQVFTYMFVHGSVEHIFFNMFGLLVFGLDMERAVGSREFVLFYLLCGTLSGLFSLAVFYAAGLYNISLIGASGAIYAVLLGYAVVFPRSTIYIWGVIPVPAPLLVAIYAGIEIVSQFAGFNGGVAHMTHLFGLAAAYLYFIVRMGIHPVKVWKDAYRS